MEYTATPKLEGVRGAPDLCRYAGSEHSVIKILFNGIVSSTCATELMTKFHRGQHFMGINSLEIQVMLLAPSSVSPLLLPILYVHFPPHSPTHSSPFAAFKIHRYNSFSRLWESCGFRSVVVVSRVRTRETKEPL